MPLSKTQIVLYVLLAIAVVLTLALHLPRWLLIVFAIGTGLVELLYDRHPAREAQPTDAQWPWHTGSFWIILAMFVVLAIVLAIAGTSPGMIAFICGLGLAFYVYDIAKRIERKRVQIRGRILRTAGVEEWTLVGISAGFCALGLLISRHDWRSGVVTITFFGTCGLVFVATILRKRREHRLRRASVQVTGGVNIYMNVTRIAYMAVGCCCVGSILYFVGTNYPLFFRLIGAFIAVVGAGLGIAIAAGLYSRPFIRFDPDAFIVSERAYQARVPWQNIAGVWTFERAHNPFVGIQLAHVEAVRVDPELKGRAFLRSVGESRALMKADLVIAPRNFGVDGVVLAGALHRYATQPHARDELIARDRIAAPESIS